MKIGELYYIRKSDPVISVVLYIKNKLYVNLGSIVTDEFPHRKRFEDVLYVDTASLERQLKELKSEDRKIVNSESIHYAKRVAFEVVFNEEDFK